MKRMALGIVAGCMALALGDSAAASDLTASQIIEKSVAARGGMEAWRKIQTMVWLGHIETEHATTERLPFVLQMKRPDMTRFDIKANNQLSVRIFDGTHGWTINSVPMKRPVVQPYTAVELHAAHDEDGIDGPLMDYQARHLAVKLEGVDHVEGHKAYRLTITFPSGASRHEWIDAKTFLEIKSDRESRNAFGMTGTVLVFYRNYQTIDGVKLPYVIESGSETSKKRDRMVIDRILINPRLDDQAFTKPDLPVTTPRSMLRMITPPSPAGAVPDRKP